jgi:hypothetical protein
MTSVNFKKATLFLPLLMLIWSASARSLETIRLFDDGFPVGDYEDRIAEIGPGKVIEFSQSTRFTVRSILGNSGRSSLILDVEELQPDRALRISKGRGKFLNSTYAGILNEIIDGYYPLKNNGVPVVDSFEAQSRRDEYVVIEKLFPEKRIGHLVPLDRFVETGGKGIAPEVVIEMKEDLIRFALSLAPFVAIGDQSGSQVLYSSKGWRIADYRNSHLFAKSKDRMSPFQRWPALVPPRTCARHFGNLLLALDFEASTVTNNHYYPLPAEIFSIVQKRYGDLRAAPEFTAPK